MKEGYLSLRRNRPILPLYLVPIFLTSLQERRHHIMIVSTEDKRASGNRIFSMFFIPNIPLRLRSPNSYVRALWYSFGKNGIQFPRLSELLMLEGDVYDSILLNLLETRSQIRVLISLRGKSCNVCVANEKATDHWRSIISVKLCNLYFEKRTDQFRPSRLLLIVVVETMK